MTTCFLSSSGRASFSQRGVAGEVTFTQVNQYIQVKVNVSGVGRDVFNWEIRPLPVDPDLEDRCSKANLGEV